MIYVTSDLHGYPLNKFLTFLQESGFTEDDFVEVGNIISEALKNKNDENIMKGLKERVSKLTSSYPLY